MMMGCGIASVPMLIVFMIGYGIGWAAFKNSPKRAGFSVLSGFTALVVTGAIVFAGCLILLSNTTFH